MSLHANDTASNSSHNEYTPLLASVSDQARDQTVASKDASNRVHTDQPQEPVIREDDWGTTRLVITLGAGFSAVFLAALDSTIVATLSGPISNSFNSFTLFPWLASGYLIANAGFQPISGKISDIFGRRPCLIAANLVFALGNLICGIARTESVMILGRVISGIGGGCINTITTFVTSDLVPLRKRGLWQGVGNILFGVGSGLGGVFGGWMNDNYNWRGAFLIQIPLILVSTSIIFYTLHIPVKETDQSKIKRVDFYGAITLVAALVLLLLGLNSGGSLVPWNHPLVYVSLPLSGILLLLFIWIEESVAFEPVIPLKLLLNRTIASGCFVNWTGSMAFFILLYYGPVYFRTKGLSATQSGVRLIPSSLGIAAGSLGSGALMRITGRYYYLNVVFQAMFVAACALILRLFDLYTPSWIPFILFFFCGLGFGATLTVSLLALISAAPHDFQAVITSASYAARSTGSTIGITIAGVIFQNLLNKNLSAALQGEAKAEELIATLRNNLEAANRLPEPLKSRVLLAIVGSLRGVWGSIFVMSALAATSGLFMRENVLFNNLART